MNLICETNKITLYDANKKLVGEVSFPDISDDTVDINHTFVDESLRGTGMASQLMNKAAEKIRAENRKAILTCTYAISWFEKHKEYGDIIKNK